MLLACLTHWYESLIFFGPIPIIALYVWISGRRQGAGGDGQRDTRASGASAPSRLIG